MKGRAERAGPCPHCGGTDRFSINTKKQVWNCRGCAKGGDVIALVRHVDGIGFAETVEKLSGEKIKPNGHARKIRERTFSYCDPTGKWLFDKTRIDFDDGSKWNFFPAAVGEGNEGKGRNGHDYALFGAEYLADVSEDKNVWIVEGEPKVLRMRELGQIAVCGDNAASSIWTPAHAALFKGLNVTLWPDSDTPGEKYIANAAACIKETAASIKVLRPFGLPNGSKGLDVCDWHGTAVERPNTRPN